MTAAAFLNKRQLLRHFHDHGSDFGAASANQYEQMASLFLTGDLTTTMVECKRKLGDVVRCDQSSGASE